MLLINVKSYFNATWFLLLAVLYALWLHLVPKMERNMENEVDEFTRDRTQTIVADAATAATRVLGPKCH